MTAAVPETSYMAVDTPDFAQAFAQHFVRPAIGPTPAPTGPAPSGSTPTSASVPEPPPFPSWQYPGAPGMLSPASFAGVPGWQWNWPPQPANCGYGPGWGWGPAWGPVGAPPQCQAACPVGAPHQGLAGQSGVPAESATAAPVRPGVPAESATAAPSAAGCAAAEPDGPPEEDVSSFDREPVQLPNRVRVAYSHSMQADIDVVPGDSLVETAALVGPPPLPLPQLTTQTQKILARTIERCSEIKPPAEPTWICDVKEAMVALAFRENKQHGRSAACASEDEIKQFCRSHLNVTINQPVYTIFGLQRNMDGSRHIKLTREAEDALIAKRAVQHDQAIEARSRVMIFKDKKHAAQYVVQRKNKYYFSLQEVGQDVLEVGPTLIRAIRKRNEWFRNNQLNKLVSQHVVHTGMYPLLQGTRPITQISPL